MLCVLLLKTLRARLRSAGECRWVSLSAQQPPHSQVTLTGGSPTFSLGKPSLQTHPLSLSLPLFFSTSRTSLSTITLTILNVLGLSAARRLKNAALGTLHRAQERAGSALHKTGPGISRPQPPSSTTKHSSQNTVQAEENTVKHQTIPPGNNTKAPKNTGTAKNRADSILCNL